MEFHPLANIFPLMTERELERLGADIAANGQIEAIYIYQEKILDGRNRFRAMERLNLEPRFEAWKADAGGEPLAFVISRNLHRRHLGESQRALAAARLSTFGQGRVPSKGGSASQVVVEAEVANRPIGLFDSLTMDEAAHLLNVGSRSVRRARMVMEQGDVTLLAAVEEGIISINDAARVVKRSTAVQRDAVAALRAGKAKTAASAAEKIEPTKSATQGRRKPLGVGPSADGARRGGDTLDASGFAESATAESPTAEIAADEIAAADGEPTVAVRRRDLASHQEQAHYLRQNVANLLEAGNVQFARLELNYILTLIDQLVVCITDCVDAEVMRG